MSSGYTAASWIRVRPHREAISRRKCAYARTRCSTVYLGIARSTHGNASCSRPFGEPSGRRSTTAPGQSGSSRPTPARRSSSLLTHCACTLSSLRQAGRSGTARSSASAVIPSVGTWVGNQPLPRTNGSSGCSAAKRATRSRHSSTDRQPASWTSYSSPTENAGCMCASTKPGRTSRPPRSTVRVRGPAHSAASPALPSATMRPSLTARASWRDRRASIAWTLPPVSTRSACTPPPSSRSGHSTPARFLRRSFCRPRCRTVRAASAA